MADVNVTDHLVLHEKDNKLNGYDNNGFHPCDKTGDEEDSANDDDRLRIVITQNGCRTEGDGPLPNGHSHDESSTLTINSVNGTAVVVLGEEDKEEDSNPTTNQGETLGLTQKPLDNRLHHYVPVEDMDQKILNGSDSTHVSIPDDAVISFSTGGRVRVKNRTSSSPKPERESIPLETIPTSYDVDDKVSLEKKAEVEAELTNTKNGVWTETNIYSSAEGIFHSEKLNGTSKSSDEVSLPVNSHRKCLSREGSSSSLSESKSTGEKLYFTDENRKLCPGWRRLILCALILIIVAVAVCLAVLAATGILLAESDNKKIRHESGHSLPSVDSINQAGFPFGRPFSHVPQKFQPSATTTEFSPNATTGTASVQDAVSPAPSSVTSKVPAFNEVPHSQTIVPNALIGEFTITDENFTDDLNDNSSQGFLNLANNLEIELRRIFQENHGQFEKLQILSFRPGSIRVKFVVIWIPNHQVILASKAAEILANDLGRKNNSFFNLFHVDLNTINFIDVFDECRIQKGGCTFDCSWNYDTLVKTCICPRNTFLQPDGKTCGFKQEITTDSSTTTQFTSPPSSTILIPTNTEVVSQVFSISTTQPTTTKYNSDLETRKHFTTQVFEKQQTTFPTSTTGESTTQAQVTTRMARKEIEIEETTTPLNAIPTTLKFKTETTREFHTESSSNLNPTTKSFLEIETENTNSESTYSTNTEENTQDSTFKFEATEIELHTEKPIMGDTTATTRKIETTTNTANFEINTGGVTESEPTLKYHIIETPTEIYTVNSNDEYTSEYKEVSVSTAITTTTHIPSLYDSERTTTNFPTTSSQNFNLTHFENLPLTTTTMVETETVFEDINPTTLPPDNTTYQNLTFSLPTNQTDRNVNFTDLIPDYNHTLSTTTLPPDVSTDNIPKETTKIEENLTTTGTDLNNLTGNEFLTTPSPSNNVTLQPFSVTPEFDHTSGSQSYDNFTNAEEKEIHTTLNSFLNETGLTTTTTEKFNTDGTLESENKTTSDKIFPTDLIMTLSDNLNETATQSGTLTTTFKTNYTPTFFDDIAYTEAKTENKLFTEPTIQYDFTTYPNISTSNTKKEFEVTSEPSISPGNYSNYSTSEVFENTSVVVESTSELKTHSTDFLPETTKSTSLEKEETTTPIIIFETNSPLETTIDLTAYNETIETTTILEAEDKVSSDVHTEFTVEKPITTFSPITVPQNEGTINITTELPNTTTGSSIEKETSNETIIETVNPVLTNTTEMHETSTVSLTENFAETLTTDILESENNITVNEFFNETAINGTAESLTTVNPAYLTTGIFNESSITARILPEDLEPTTNVTTMSPTPEAFQTSNDSFITQSGTVVILGNNNTDNFNFTTVVYEITTPSMFEDKENKTEDNEMIYRIPSLNITEAYNITDEETDTTTAETETTTAETETTTSETEIITAETETAISETTYLSDTTPNATLYVTESLTTGIPFDENFTEPSIILPTTNFFENATEGFIDNTTTNFTPEYTTASTTVQEFTTVENLTTQTIETTTEFNKTEVFSEINITNTDSTLNLEHTSDVGVYSDMANFTTATYDESTNETTSTSSGIECRTDQFICEPLNVCLNYTFMCDGILDCPDGTDEFDCQDTCHTNFMCTNSSTCIMNEARCDGIWDCENGTDEEFCRPTECAKHEVMCSDGSKCIKPVDICDWKYDCKDRIDEVGCVERTTCESNGKFFCNDGLCIPWSLKCDGEFDCKDKEDESNCTCMSDEFQCNDGKCLKSSSRCDGHRDCHDGDDEMGCVNVDSQHTVITYEPYSGTWALLCAEDFNLDDGHYLCQELGFGHALKVDKLHVSFNGTWMAMRRDNLTDASLWTERVSFVESCTTSLAAAVECQKFACGEYTGLLHRRRKRDILGSSSSSQWPFIGYTSTFQSNRGCLSEILTPIWLITSAECLLSIRKEPFNGSDWYVQTNIGQKTETDLAQNHEVLRIITHPHSSKFRSLIVRDYDVALVRLKHALVFVSDKIGAICPPEEQVPAGITCFSGVLGTEKPRAPPPAVLSINSLALQILDRKNCNTIDHYDNSINQRMLCTQSSEGHTICDNDEGTPLMCLTGINKWFLAGMLTYQRYCEVYSKHPAVFSNLYAMRKFIDQVTGQKQYEIPYDSNVYVIIPPTTPSPPIPETTTPMYTSTEYISTTETIPFNFTDEYTTIEPFSTNETTETTLETDNLSTLNFTEETMNMENATTPYEENMRIDENVTALSNLSYKLHPLDISDSNFTTLTHLEYENDHTEVDLENVTAPEVLDLEETFTPMTISENFTENDLENITIPETTTVVDFTSSFENPLTTQRTDSITETNPYVENNITKSLEAVDFTTETQISTTIPENSSVISTEFNTAEHTTTNTEKVNVTEVPFVKVIGTSTLNSILTPNINLTTLPSNQSEYFTITVSSTEPVISNTTDISSEGIKMTDNNSTTTASPETDTLTFELESKPDEDLAVEIFTNEDGLHVESHMEKFETIPKFMEHVSRSRNFDESHNISDILYDSNTNITTQPTLVTEISDELQNSRINSSINLGTENAYAITSLPDSENKTKLENILSYKAINSKLDNDTLISFDLKSENPREPEESRTTLQSSTTISNMFISTRNESSESITKPTVAINENITIISDYLTPNPLEVTETPKSLETTETPNLPASEAEMLAEEMSAVETTPGISDRTINIEDTSTQITTETKLTSNPSRNDRKYENYEIIPDNFTKEVRTETSTYNLHNPLTTVNLTFSENPTEYYNTTSFFINVDNQTDAIPVFNETEAIDMQPIETSTAIRLSEKFLSTETASLTENITTNTELTETSDFATTDFTTVTPETTLIEDITTLETETESSTSPDTTIMSTKTHETTTLSDMNPFERTAKESPNADFLNSTIASYDILENKTLDIDRNETETFPDFGIEYLPVLNNLSWHLSSEKLTVLEDNITENCGRWNNNRTSLDGLKFYEQWPALGYLQMITDQKMCAATILSPFIIITSLNCLLLRDPQLDPERWVFVAGLNYSTLVKGLQRHLVDSIIPHAMFEESSVLHEHNLALVKLIDAIDVGEFSTTACLPRSSDDWLAQCFTAGWSKSQPGVNQVNQFYSVPVNMIPQEECNSTIGYNGLLQNSLICASHDNTSLPICQMDQGSPLFCFNDNHWLLQGILDFTGPCDIAQPAVYNNLSSDKDWIYQFLK